MKFIQRMIAKFLTPSMKQFIRFCAVGVLNTLVGYLSFRLFWAVLHIPETIANIGSYFVGMVNSLIWNTLFTFKQKQFNFKQSALFILVFLVSLAIQTLIFRWIRDTFHLYPDLAWLLSAVLYTLIQFFGNKLVTFREKPSDGAASGPHS